jgi:hypothetical protein
MFGVIVIAQITDVPGQHKHITCLLERVLLKIAPVVGELQMEV